MINSILHKLDQLKDYEVHYKQVSGVKTMVQGLEYHFDNYMAQTKVREQPFWFHEVVAYLNRLGQIYYFFKSDFIKVVDSEMPNILKIIPLRMKYSAHRSVDAPRGNDHLVMMDISMPNIHYVHSYYGSEERDVVNPNECSRGFCIPRVDANGDRDDVRIFLDYEHDGILADIGLVLDRKLREFGI
ncbi:hypothetical protein ATS72_004900 [Pseudoalteromonas sp. 13-15]|jgi:hypothetical protein|uniref:hypothetical protein n=1 Tax=Pseudoalteromonas TaxID=53246 RepID=UPI00057B7C9C|nr:MULTISPECIES: hypothetical protein [Pseudoalteromonas]ATG58619.1 hypothetical protein CPA52_10345 [Pseudoalteromonas marina]AUL72984.1 hypothetical protein ATS72_004900 [Pseudoalteromonas sp. 13-15]MBB1445524.1 hypothetical protein [Pseudoalteromonas sp. SG43-3]MBB1450241.1 hypothetical protein [Pseudoalteromonas sp. SG43-1]MBH0030321.1 hypothetical protein [Pseudoalteromonas sp. SWYJZ98]|tara:strand:+ start:237 stop:794 length:558 start_codon:yes stop_codon:yes gene_type:complete